MKETGRARLLSMFMAVVMVLGTMPANAVMAEEDDEIVVFSEEPGSTAVEGADSVEAFSDYTEPVEIYEPEYTEPAEAEAYEADYAEPVEVEASEPDYTEPAEDSEFYGDRPAEDTAGEVYIEDDGIVIESIETVEEEDIPIIEETEEASEDAGDPNADAETENETETETEDGYGISLLNVIDNVSYIDENGATQTAEEAAEVTGDDTAWSDGWYVVDSIISNSNRITVSGTVNLILTDECVLTADSGIQVDPGNTLNIYGQSGSTGELIATGVDNYAAIGGNDSSSGSITINGGVITANAGARAAGIGGGYGCDGGKIKITGGKVNAEGGGSGAGIGGGPNGSGGEITISGGTVTATGIGGGGGADGGTITIENCVIYANAVSGFDALSPSGIIYVGEESGLATVYGSPVFSSDVCIPEGMTAWIEEGKTVTIAEGYTLTNEGTLCQNWGSTFTGNGTYADNGTTYYEIKHRYYNLISIPGAISFADSFYAKANETVALSVSGGYEVSDFVLTGNRGETITPDANSSFLLSEPVKITAHAGVGDFSVSGGDLGTDYLYEDQVLTILSASPLTIAMADGVEKTITDYIVAGEGAEADLTLDGVYIDMSYYADTAAMDLQEAGACTITLTDGSENTFLSGQNRAGIEVPDGFEITFDGSGILTVLGGNYGAGIGGGNGRDGGKITIMDGTIMAQGGNYGAGIGGGCYGNGGTITIEGGDIKAAGGGAYGAGIGGGDYGNGGTITISGGWTTAYGSWRAAGIGGGDSGNGGTITITDGTITATGGDYGTGIGGGIRGNGGTITIEGGTVYANGGDLGAGIGSGYVSDGGSIKIKGGDITATGGGDSAGIGGGYKGDGGAITIEGGTITATGEEGGAGIGGGSGSDGGAVMINSGTVIASCDNVGYGISGTFTTGTDGHAVIYASSIEDTSDSENWSGIISPESLDGEAVVYGSPIITTDESIPSGKTAHIEEEKNVTITDGTTFTNEGTVYQDWSSTFIRTGTYADNGSTYYEAESEIGGYEVDISLGGTTSYSDASYAVENSTVSVVLPDGYDLSDLSVVEYDDSEVSASDDSFIMPSEPVMVTGLAQREITADMFTVDTEDETYRGSEISKEILSDLMEGTDYTVSYENNTNAGTATITITGKGSYTGELTYTFTIQKAAFGTGDVSATGYSGTYDGEAHSITVTLSGKAEGAKVTYSTEKNGSYTEKNPACTKAGTYTVYYKVSKTNYTDVAGSETVKIDQAPVSTTTTTALLMLKGDAAKKSVTLSWNKVQNADGYIIYGARCGKKVKELATVEGRSNTTCKVKSLKKSTRYKFRILAYKTVNGERKTLKKSNMIHVVTTSKKYTNVKSVKVSQSEVYLRLGRTKKITASYRLAETGKKLAGHMDYIRYASSDKSVATVNKKGRITAVGKGACKIYAYAANGSRKKITVTVR